jgi:predicted phage terminase large subunit-like protein
MSTFISLIDFWRIQRQQDRELCIIKPFHHTIANALTKLVLGTLPTPNLMILMPPRCGKTDLVTKAFIPWALSYFPDSEFITSSYASDLADANSICIRNTLSSEWYRSIIRSDWGATVQMRGDSGGGRVDFFHTLQGGSVKAIGTGGGITGFGAGKLRKEFGGCISIDDPLKAQDARSPAKRLAGTAYLENTLKPRRNRDDTPILLVMQRLHPQDPAGYVLQQERHLWTVIQIPALDENNESIWEERISAKSLLEMKESNPELFWSQYMQEPSESAQTIFKRAWWKYWQDLKEVESRLTFKYITADTAFKAKDSADWSVFQCWGIEGIKGMHLIDQLKGKWEFPELLVNAKAFWQKHATPTPGITPASEFWIEDKASGTSLVQTMRSQGGVPVRPWSPTDKTSPDKVGRANQCTPSVAAGRIFLPDLKLYKWVDGFVNEHEAFTADDSHLNDDQVDACTMAQLIWQQRGGGRGPIPLEFNISP